MHRPSGRSEDSFTQVVQLSSPSATASTVDKVWGTQASQRETRVSMDQVGILPVVELYDARRDIRYAKPRWRGWLHLIAFELALVLGTVVVARTTEAGVRTAAVVYAASVAGMFGASALYHRGNWSARVASRLQRLDHMMIFFAIAGSATPAFVVCVPRPWSWLGLAALWLLTAIAAAARLLRMHLPEWLAGAIFLTLGWLAGGSVPAVWAAAGVVPAVLVVIGGVLYTVGALVYHLRGLDLRPTVFGYHEVFHGFVTAAAACQYIAIACFVL